MPSIEITALDLANQQFTEIGLASKTIRAEAEDWNGTWRSVSGIISRAWASQRDSETWAAEAAGETGNILGRMRPKQLLLHVEDYGEAAHTLSDFGSYD